MSKKVAPTQERPNIEDFHRYYGGGKVFPVTEDDLVFVIGQDRKRKPTGYNHARAWHAALKAATT